MRTEFVYSFLALGAIPVTVNAADVQAISSDVLASPEGMEVKYSVGKLVPGSYIFTAKVTSKVYDVTIKIGGNTVTLSNPGSTAQNASVSFTLTEETDIELSLVSSDPGESGAGFTVADAVVGLDYNFSTIKTTLANNANALATTIVGYNYAAKQEDVDAANALKTKANGIAESYDDYKNFKLYAEKSTIQVEIDALQEKAGKAEADYQNEQAYNRVNAAIAAIKAKYNAAVAELEAALVNQAAYLLDAAKADLNEEINLKITEATQACYASYQAGTAVADEATNTALVPVEGDEVSPADGTLNYYVKKWKDQGTDNQGHYDTLHDKVTALQAALDAVTYADNDAAITAAFADERAAAQSAIDDINTKVENARNSAAQLTLNVDADETAANTKITTLADKVNKANAEYNANKDTKDAIATLQTNLNNAKTTVNDKVSVDGNYKAADYYEAYVQAIQEEIDGFSTAAATAYKADGTGTAQKYNTDFSATATQTKIDNYETNAVKAVENYDVLQVAINGNGKAADDDDYVAGYQKELDDARALVEELAIYTDETYDYKTQLDLLQKCINDIKKAIAAAEEKVGEEHWTAMLAIGADAAISTDIAALVAKYQTDQNQYDKDYLATGITSLAERITEFGTTYATGGNTKLGADYQVFADAETAIKAKKDAIETARAAITTSDAAAAATIVDLGKQIDAVKAEQDALEAAASAVATKVTANTKDKTDLTTNIGNQQTALATFKSTYKVGQDDSTLGNRGKADGSVTTEVTAIETALTALNTANDAFVPTNVTEVDMKGATTGLANGVYDIEIEVEGEVAGTVTVNGKEINDSAGTVIVSDSTLTAVADEGVTVTFKTVTYHENDLTEAYTKTDGYNKQCSDLAARVTKLQDDAPSIKTAVENQTTAKTAADEAMTDLGTFELNTLKSLKNVTNANAVSDDPTAKKDDPDGFKVFETGLDDDKTYTARKDAIDADIRAMTAAITAARNAETLPTPWAGTISVTEGETTTAYSIDELKTAINQLNTDAATESDNYEAYKALQDENMSKLLPDTISVNATDAGEGALEYYQGLKTQYIADKHSILTSMQTSLTKRIAVTDKDGYIDKINALIEKVKVVKSDAAANLAKYTEQKTAAEETQTLWNQVYTEIAATNHSTKVQEWLDQLDAIQVDLTAATNAIEENYKIGKSVEEAKDIAAIKVRINNVKAQENSAYNDDIAADALAAHKAFTNNNPAEGESKGAIEQATAVYQAAVAERAKYSSTNTTIQTAIEDAAAELDEYLYGCPNQIQTLTETESAAYVANSEANAALADGERATAYDASQYIKDALTIEQAITDKLTAFRTNIATAMDGVWTPLASQYNDKVSDAETAIASYSTAAKTDAFKDVKDAIAKGNAAVTKDADGNATAVDIAKLESAMNTLADIDNMLAADKDDAAVKDIDALLETVESKYTEVKDYIEGVTNDISEKSTNLTTLTNAYNNSNVSTNGVAYAKSLTKNFSNHNNIVGILNAFISTANACKTAVETAVAADNANTEAYNAMTEALSPVETKLADAKTLAAGYKYETSFATNETEIDGLSADAETYKSNGSAVANKATFLTAVATASNNIDATLTTAFGTEKTGLSGDITELKSQWNTYVAANGLDETATAFKTAIDELETALANATIVDLDDPADDIDYDDIKAATEALIELQGKIADKLTELLAANASTANADVLADFQSQITALEQTASLDDYDEWVANQQYGDSTLGETIADLKAQLAEVKAAIEAEDNISFYKEQYQAQIDAIKAALERVAAVIADKDAQFKANAAAYETLSAEIEKLQDNINAAKEKVGAYEYASTIYLNMIEQYNNDGELTSGAQYNLKQAKATIEAANESKSLDENSLVANKAIIETTVQSYLDNSAYYELIAQKNALSTALTNAINVGQDEEDYTPKYSNALWGRLITEKGGIADEIVALGKAIEYSYSTQDENDDDKLVTSDADYAAQMNTVNAIKAEIEALSTAVDNLGLLGDANEDGKVNVLDYQKVLNMILDPTLQPKEESDLFANLDINQSDVIEVGDLTAIVNYILTNEWATGYAAARGMNATEESLSMNASPLSEGKQRIAVSLDNVSAYTAFQMDVVLPEGMTLVGTSLTDRAGQSHKLYSRTQLDGSIRLLASSVTGETFSGNEGAVLYIDVEGAGNVELLNILFSDENAQTRCFAIGGDATGIDTVGTFEALKQKVYDLGGRLKDNLKKGFNIIRRADGSTQKVVK